MDYNSTGAMRSPFSPRMRPSIGGRRAIGSAKKNAQSKLLQEEEVGDVIYKSPMLTVETYGAPLPVMVTEALTFGSGEVSVKLSSCGWCWVVTGRRVMAWEREEAGAAARELTLPQTDLAHKADLVEMFYEEGAVIPSCVGVSPEGVVRYWPCVAQEAAYVDVACELAGQECDRVCAPDPDTSAPSAPSAPTTLVLATTTCTLVLLSPAEKDGRATVTCKTLRPPSGWLGGIGRRVSLLFFGSTTGHADTRLVGVVWWGAERVALVGDGGAGPVLQLWAGGGGTQHALRPLLAPQLAHPAHPDPTALDLQALDVTAAPGPAAALLLLVAVVNVARSPEVRYAIAHISLEAAGEPAVRSVTSVRWAGGAGGGGDPPRLVALDARHVILYTGTTLVYAGDGEGAVQLAGSDRVVSAARCGGAALAFLARHGVVRVRCSGAAAATAPPPAPAPDSELALLALDPRELAPHAGDTVARLQTAFLFHLRREPAAARALLPAPPPAADDVDAALDRSVLAVAVDMLDDMPAGDPRWKNRTGSSSISLGSSSALQILLQLQDKKRAFTLFLEFLRALGLWQQMQNVTFEGNVVRTRWALGALAERLAAALALRALQHQADQPLLDAAIYRMVQEEEEEGAEGEEAGAGLPPADVWYRRVTRAHRVLAALPPDSPAPAAALHALAILNHVLSEMQACRAQWAGGDAPPSPHAAPPSPPSPPWLRPLLDFQRRVVLETARECGAEVVRAQLLEGAARLAELLLEAARPSPPAPPSPPALYEHFRRDALRPFWEVGQRERAAVLAEKFGDFELLIQMCLEDDDWPRLHHYMDKYADRGFPERAFACAAEAGGAAARRLVELGAGGEAGAGGEVGARLERWLLAARCRGPLLAARHLALGHRPRAAAALAHLARDEHQWMCRGRTAAALAKLCALAGEGEEGGELGEEARRSADDTLALCEHQDSLPKSLSRTVGLAPLSADELVRLYVEEEDDDLTEYDYKKALDLTHYVADEDERQRLRLQVWCAALRRDSWDDTASDVEAAALLRDKMFFRLADLVNLMGEELESVLPPLEALEAVEGSPAARYLLRTGYTLLGVPRPGPGAPRP